MQLFDAAVSAAITGKKKGVGKFLHKNYPSQIKETLRNVVEYFMNHTKTCDLCNLSLNTQLQYEAHLWKCVSASKAQIAF